VACLSWEPDGTRNAKYWVMHMLAHTLGSDERSIQPVTNRNDDAVFVGAEAMHFPSLQRKSKPLDLDWLSRFLDRSIRKGNRDTRRIPPEEHGPAHPAAGHQAQRYGGGGAGGGGGEGGRQRHRDR